MFITTLFLLFFGGTIGNASKIEMSPQCRERAAWGAIGCKFGDTAGFMNGDLEFNFSTEEIHSIYWQKESPRILNDLATKTFMYSDDTIFCDMTTSVLADQELRRDSTYAIVSSLISQYVKYKEDPLWFKRAHGNTMQDSLTLLQSSPHDWLRIPYQPWKTGCGAAMRTMPMGEAFAGESNRQKLMEVSLASSYATHTSPKGFLGGVASALFTALACEDCPFSAWICHLRRMVDANNGCAFVYANSLVTVKEHLSSYIKDWRDFEGVCDFYFKTRFNRDGSFDLDQFHDTPKDRDRFYIQFTAVNGESYPWERGSLNRDGWAISKDCWPGAKGSEAPLMAYDALMLTIHKFLLDNRLTDQYSLATLTPKQYYRLVKNANAEARQRLFKDLLERACLHGGDSDSTGAIAFYIQAIMLKELSIPEVYLKHLEPSLFLSHSLTRTTELLNGSENELGSKRRSVSGCKESVVKGHGRRTIFSWTRVQFTDMGKAVVQVSHSLASAKSTL